MACDEFAGHAGHCVSSLHAAALTAHCEAHSERCFPVVAVVVVPRVPESSAADEGLVGGIGVRQAVTRHLSRLR